MPLCDTSEKIVQYDIEICHIRKTNKEFAICGYLRLKIIINTAGNGELMPYASLVNII